MLDAGPDTIDSLTLISRNHGLFLNMSEIFKIVLTSSFTIVGGVIIFVMGQIISKFLIEPIHEQRKTIGEIADSLIFYANVYGNPGLGPKEKMDEAYQRLRELATLLQSKTHLIPFYSFFSSCGMVQKPSDIQEASSQLIGLSNSVYQPPDDPVGTALSNAGRADKIKRLLNLGLVD
jgi:hypothetical protein